jgi:uncharacterized protein YbjQ (UPF0145 family)
MSFTSDLSVGEFAVAAEAGLRPLRLVGGAGVFYLPPPLRPDRAYVQPGQVFLMAGAAGDWNRARDTVLGRLRDEARSCGARVVTGVDVRREIPRYMPGASGKRDWYQVFTATGTAMAHDSGGTAANRAPDTAAADTAAADGPVLTNLRVADYRKLAGLGSAPVGLVTATAIAGGRSAWDYDIDAPAGSQAHQYAVAHPPDYSPNARSLKDRPEYHLLMRKAYSAALDKLRADAARLGASGIAAIRIERARAEREWTTEGDHQNVVFVHAMGTAVAVARTAPERRPLTLIPVRHLNG